jgi:hypothetical protein
MALTLFASSSVGCAHVCPKVAKELREFDQQAAPAKGHDLALSLPSKRIDKLIAPEIARLPKFAFKAPAVGKVKLPTFQVVVEALQIRSAPTNRLGFSVRVSLRASKKRLLVLNIRGDSPTRFDPKVGVLRVSLKETKLSQLETKIGQGGTKALSAWVWSQIPKQLRQFTPRSVVNSVVDSVARSAVKNMGQLLNKHAPHLLSQLASLEIDFDDLPIAAVEVHSGGGYVEVLARSTLEGSRPLAAPRGRRPGVAKDHGQLRLSGSAAAALANDAIASGEIPERWNREGEADEKGEFKARVDWKDGKRPLKVELFADSKKDCAHLRLAATPKLSVRKGDIQFATSDAHLEKVIRGSLRVRTAIALSGLGRRSFSLVERIASSFEACPGRYARAGHGGTRQLAAPISWATRRYSGNSGARSPGRGGGSRHRGSR